MNQQQDPDDDDDAPEIFPELSDVEKDWAAGISLRGDRVAMDRNNTTVGELLAMTDSQITRLTTENLVTVADAGRRLLTEAVIEAFDHGDELFLADARTHWPGLLDAVLRQTGRQ